MAKLETKEYAISRAFDHKTFGRIGIVEMSAGVSGVSINGKELPASSIEYLLTFALQNLQDAYAGADSEVDAKARWEKKLDRLLEGSIGLRASGGGESAEVRTRRAVIKEQVRKAVGKDKWTAFQALDADAQGEKLDAVFEKQDDAGQAAIMEQVAKRLAEAAQRKAQANKLAESIDLDI